MEGDSHPEITDLKRIRSLSQFDDAQLTSLAGKLELQYASKNSCLIERGCSESFSLYLIAGTLDATAQDEKVTRFESSAASELFPIAQIRPSMYQVVATGPVTYLKIYASQLTEFAQRLENNDAEMDVVEIEQSDEENALTIQLFQDLVSGNLK